MPCPASRLVVALLMLYVGIDFCEPFLPGAVFNFNPDLSVATSCADSRHPLGQQSPRVVSPSHQAHPVACTLRPVVRSPLTISSAGPPAHVSRSHLAGRAAAPAAPGEDH